jgi:hypothetical protein
LFNPCSWTHESVKLLLPDFNRRLSHTVAYCI